MFSLEDLEDSLGSGAVLVAGLLMPGFVEDLSTWIVTVGPCGERIRQVREWGSYLPTRQGTLEVSPDWRSKAQPAPIQIASLERAEVEEILRFGGECGFLDGHRSLAPTEWRITDQPSEAVGCRVADRIGITEYYAADFAAVEEKSPLASAFCEIRDRIVANS